ncbi:MAG: low molecular weight phosphotyrosine protein phosphatase [Myxococcota bacterium]
MADQLPRHLLFVCSGNLCRSPMAAAIARHVAMELALEVEVASAGTLGIVGRPAERRAAAVCREIGLDLADHVSQALTPEWIRWADRIYVMEPAHATRVRELVPEVGEIVVQLGPLAGEVEIHDPTGSWFVWPFRRTRDALRRAIVKALSAEQHRR